MEKPLNPFEQTAKPGGRIIDKPDLPRQGFAVHMEADLETMEDELQLKVGKSRGFTVYTDESLEKIATLVRNAKAGCFAENLVVQQVPSTAQFR